VSTCFLSQCHGLPWVYIKRTRPNVPGISSVAISAGAMGSELTSCMHVHNLQEMAAAATELLALLCSGRQATAKSSDS